MFLWFMLSFFCACEGSHFRGGSITAAPVIYTETYATMKFDIDLAWRRSAAPYTYCDDNYLNNGPFAQSLIGGNYNITCDVGCWKSGEVLGTTSFYCTSYSVLQDWTFGQKSFVYNASITSNYQVSFANGNWINLVEYGQNSSLIGLWEMRLKIDTRLRNDTLKVNSAPACFMLPMFQLVKNTQYFLRIPYSDVDNDVVRCRWSEYSKRECGDICHAVSFVNLDSDNCVAYVNLTNAISGWYAMALQVEDFQTSTDTNPMSSVPLQFLLLIQDPVSNCTLNPLIIGEWPESVCMVIPVNYTIAWNVVAETQCENSSITTIELVGPSGLFYSGLQKSTNTTWFLSLSWTPTASQFGPNLICAIASDTNLLSSLNTCYTILVGNEFEPYPVSFYPNGTLFIDPNNNLNTSIHFTIEFNILIQPSVTISFIRIVNLFDESDFLFISPQQFNITGKFLQFNLPAQFLTPNVSYYLVFDDGLVSGTKYCRPVSKPIFNKQFWQLNVVPTQTQTTNLTSETSTTMSITPQFITMITSLNFTTTTPSILCSDLSQKCYFLSFLMAMAFLWFFLFGAHFFAMTLCVRSVLRKVRKNHERQMSVYCEYYERRLNEMSRKLKSNKTKCYQSFGKAYSGRKYE